MTDETDRPALQAAIEYAVSRLPELHAANQIVYHPDGGWTAPETQRSFCAGYAFAEQRANEKLRVAREALESIAFGEQPRADDFKFWLQKGSAEAAETLAEDTHIARSALKALED